MHRLLRSAALGLLAFTLTLPALAQDLDAVADAQQMMSTGDFGSAQIILEMAVDDDPDHVEAQYLLGMAYGAELQSARRDLQAGLARKALGALNRAVELDPAHYGAREMLVQFHMGAPSSLGGDQDLAQQHAEAAMENAPDRGWALLGLVLQVREDLEGAAAIYREGVASAPATFEAQSPAVFFFQQQEDFDEALAILRPLAEAGEWAAHYQIGRTASFSGQYLDEGAASLKAYIADYTPVGTNPSHAHANNRLGQIYVHQGRTDEARAAFERALELDPSIDSARQALEELQ